MTHLEADFIVVGAGTSGCLVARRLLERTDATVLLLESGPAYPAFVLDVPLASLSLRRKWSWSLRSVPQASLLGRSILFPMGRVVGGSSAVNAMIAVPGMPQTFDAWGDAGGEGWRGSEMMQAFGRAAAEDGSAPITISESRHRAPFSEAFLDACVESGLKQTRLLRGDAAETCGWFPVFQNQGKRQSAGRVVLATNSHSQRLRLLTGVDVRRVVFDNRIATGVELVSTGKRVQTYARQGVILAAGALGSPKLLLCSGIGSADVLCGTGVNLEVDLPGVGENLQDHFGVPLVYASKQPSPGRKSRWVTAAWQYLRSRDGVMASTCGEVGCFLTVGNENQQSMIELFAMFQTNRVPQGVELMCVLSQPMSSGSIRLNPDDPWGSAVIDPNYLSHSQDLDTLIKGMHRAREIASCPALRSFGLADESRPKGMNDREYISTHGTTFHHPVGGCCMGQDEMAVVDPELRVRGTDRLWVADNSIAPCITNAHTAALALMIGERAADLITAETRKAI